MAHIREVERKTGKAFEVRWREHGTDRQKTFPTRRAAERHAGRVEDKLRRDNNSDGLYERHETVERVMQDVMASAERKLKPRTYDSYRKLYAARVLPKFGNRRISTITSREVEAWLGELSESGLAPATVRHCSNALSKLMKYAVRHRLISVNPCTDVEKPKIETPPGGHGRFLRPSQVEAIAAELDEPYDLLVRFAAFTGLRAGEIAGLRVRDINLLRRSVRVEQTLQRVNGKWIYGTPKSAKSIRSVPLLHSGLVRDLEEYLEKHPRRTNPDALLWPGRGVGGGSPIDYTKPFHQGSFYRWHFRAALVRAGLLGQVVQQGDVFGVGCCDRQYFTQPEAVRHVAGHATNGPRFHDLRHTAGSAWLEAGIPIHEVSWYLGHSTIAITVDVYGHRSDDHSANAGRMEAWLAAQ